MSRGTVSRKLINALLAGIIYRMAPIERLNLTRLGSIKYLGPSLALTSSDIKYTAVEPRGTRMRKMVMIKAVYLKKTVSLGSVTSTYGEASRLRIDVMN